MSDTSCPDINFNVTRSNTMYSLNEALARERMREARRHASQVRLARELPSQRRWHRPSSR